MNNDSPPATAGQVEAQNQNQATPKIIGVSRNSSRISRNYSKKRDEMTERQQREANLGAILVCISLLFILCQSIKIIPDVSYIGFANAVLYYHPTHYIYVI